MAQFSPDFLANLAAASATPTISQLKDAAVTASDSGASAAGITDGGENLDDELRAPSNDDEVMMMVDSNCDVIIPSSDKEGLLLEDVLLEGIPILNE
jgi:hypothetical protein